MRIIAGKFKGRKLLDEFNKDIIRPTQDRVRESVLNILSSNIINASILDLFCGTGAYGLESLSRGAKTCIFVDNDTISLNLAKKNLEKINIEKVNLDASFIQTDYLNFLKTTSKKFDIIFADAPYKLGEDINVLKSIISSGVLGSGCMLVYETTYGVEEIKNKKEKLLIDNIVNEIGENFSLKVKNYGSKNVVFIKEKDERD